MFGFGGGQQKQQMMGSVFDKFNNQVQNSAGASVAKDNSSFGGNQQAPQQQQQTQGSTPQGQPQVGYGPTNDGTFTGGVAGGNFSTGGSSPNHDYNAQNGMTREAYRDKWMSSGVSNPDQMRAWLAANGGQMQSDNGTVTTPYGETLDLGTAFRSGQGHPGWTVMGGGNSNPGYGPQQGMQMGSMMGMAQPSMQMNPQMMQQLMSQQGSMMPQKPSYNFDPGNPQQMDIASMFGPKAMMPQQQGMNLDLKSPMQGGNTGSIFNRQVWN